MLKKTTKTMIFIGLCCQRCNNSICEVKMNKYLRLLWHWYSDISPVVCIELCLLTQFVFIVLPVKKNALRLYLCNLTFIYCKIKKKRRSGRKLDELFTQPLRSTRQQRGERIAVSLAMWEQTERISQQLVKELPGPDPMDSPCTHWPPQEWEMAAHTSGAPWQHKIEEESWSKGSLEKNKYVKRPLLTSKSPPAFLSKSTTLDDLRDSVLYNWDQELKSVCPMKITSINLHVIQTNSWERLYSTYNMNGNRER